MHKATAQSVASVDTSFIQPERINSIIRYPDGNPEYFIQHDSAGGLNGVFAKWYPNGNLAFNGNYKPVTGIQFDELDSMHTGKAIRNVPVKVSVEAGEWRFYNEDGALRCIGNYDSVFGYLVVYTVNEDAFVETSIEMSLKSGEWLYYGADGKLIKRETWLHGNLKKSEIFGSE